VFQNNKEGTLNLLNRNTTCVRTLSYIVAVTWFLEEHMMFYRILAIKKNSHLYRTCSRNIALVHWILHFLHWILHIQKCCCKLKNTLHMVQKYSLVKGILYHFEENYIFWKGMLHPLEDSSVCCRGIDYWKTFVFSQQKTAHEWTMLLCKQGTIHCYIQNYILEQEYATLNSCYTL
jgi:hypothetical protein